MLHGVIDVKTVGGSYTGIALPLGAAMPVFLLSGIARSDAIAANIPCRFSTFRTRL